MRTENGATGRSMRGATLAATALLVMGTTVSAAAAAPATLSTGCTTTSGAAIPAKVDGRSFAHHVPDGVGSTPLPLILAFHGASTKPGGIETYSKLDSADAVVVYPRGRTLPGSDKRGWAPNNRLTDVQPDLTYTLDLVAAVERSYCIDTDRVYATGKSEGGGFTYALACDEPGLLAAIAPVAGAFYRPGSTYHGVSDCASGPLPVLEFHGVEDSVIAYDDLHRSAGEADGPTPGRSRPIRTVDDPARYAADTGWVDEWVARDHCADAAGNGLQNSTDDARFYSWTDCADGTRVEHYELLDGGHTWPGSEDGTSGGGGDPTDEAVDATAAMLRFFDVAQS